MAGVHREKVLLFLGCDTNLTAAILEKLCRWKNSELELVVVATRRPRHCMFQDLLKRLDPPTVILLEFDIANEESYDPFAARVFDTLKQNGRSKLSALVLCCGRLFPRWNEPMGIDPTHMMKLFLSITIRPVLLIQTFLPYLIRDENDPDENGSIESGSSSLENKDLLGKTSSGGYDFNGCLYEAFDGKEPKTVIINLTTMTSSVSETRTVNHLSYQCAKCSQNMAIKALANELKENDVLIYSLAMDNGALWVKQSRKVEFAPVVNIYEESETGEVEVTQCEIGQDEVDGRPDTQCVSYKEGISLKDTAEGIMRLLSRANPLLSGHLINGQGVPMKF